MDPAQGCTSVSKRRISIWGRSQAAAADASALCRTAALRGTSKLQARMEGDHAGRAIGAQADAKQPGGGRNGIGERAKAGLRGGFAGDAGQHIGGQAKIAMIEYVEKLAFEA